MTKCACSGRAPSCRPCRALSGWRCGSRLLTGMRAGEVAGLRAGRNREPGRSRARRAHDPGRAHQERPRTLCPALAARRRDAAGGAGAGRRWRSSSCLGAMRSKATCSPSPCAGWRTAARRAGRRHMARRSADAARPATDLRHAPRRARRAGRGRERGTQPRARRRDRPAL